MVASNMLSTIGLGQNGLSALPIVNSSFPVPVQGVNTVLVGSGSLSQDQSKQEFPGGCPTIALFDVDGGIIGTGQASSVSQGQDGSFCQVSVPGTRSPAYLKLRAPGPDTACINWIQITTSGHDLHSWNAAAAAHCGLPSHESTALLPGTSFTPPCVLLGADGQHAEGMSIRLQDFSLQDGNKAEAVAEQWNADPDSLCKIPARQQFYNSTEIPGCVPLFADSQTAPSVHSSACSSLTKASNDMDSHQAPSGDKQKRGKKGKRRQVLARAGTVAKGKGKSTSALATRGEHAPPEERQTKGKGKGKGKSALAIRGEHAPPEEQQTKGKGKGKGGRVLVRGDMAGKGKGKGNQAVAGAKTAGGGQRPAQQAGQGTPANPVFTPAHPVFTPANPVFTPANPIFTPAGPIATPAAAARPVATRRPPHRRSGGSSRDRDGDNARDRSTNQSTLRARQSRTAVSVGATSRARTTTPASSVFTPANNPVFTPRPAATRRPPHRRSGGPSRSGGGGDRDRDHSGGRSHT